MSKKKNDDTKIHYKGGGSIEVGIGNYSRVFKPGQTAVVEDSRIRAELLGMDGFKSGPAPEKKKDNSGKPKAQSPKTAAAKEAGKGAGVPSEVNNNE